MHQRTMPVSAGAGKRRCSSSAHARRGKFAFGAEIYHMPKSPASIKIRRYRHALQLAQFKRPAPARGWEHHLLAAAASVSPPIQSPNFGGARRCCIPLAEGEWSALQLPAGKISLQRLFWPVQHRPELNFTNPPFYGIKRQWVVCVLGHAALQGLYPGGLRW